jgi:hypothetical protein
MTPWIRFLHVIELILDSGDSTIPQISKRQGFHLQISALEDASLIFLHLLQHGCHEFKNCAVRQGMQ